LLCADCRPDWQLFLSLVHVESELWQVLLSWPHVVNCEFSEVICELSELLWLLQLVSWLLQAV
jgi:hypothetical protein